MFRIASIVLLASAAMAGTVWADDSDPYMECWSSQAVAYLNKNGTTERTLDRAATFASKSCRHRKEAYAAANSNEEADDLEQYMIVQLYNSNPIDDEKVASIQAGPAVKPFEYPKFKPRVGYNLMNAKTGFLCKYVWDVENARQLVETNRADKVEKTTSCVVFDKSIEVEKIKGAGTWTIEVRYTNANGKMITAYTSDRTFRPWGEWARMSCSLAGNSDAVCSDTVKF